MKTHPRIGRPAFTLIELMAVITIIVILAGLVVGGLGYVNERQARSKAQVQIALLSKALEEYKLDMGQYPGDAINTGAAGTGITQQLYTALFYEGYDYSTKKPPPDRWEKTVGSVTVPKSTKIYLPDLDPRTSKQGWVNPATGATPPATLPAPFIQDPWGKEYRYRKGTSAMNPDFDLWSTGKNGLSRTGNTPTDLKHADNNDDIRNF
jgi:prepilin-type N-terminal cleavage/methylation domain-containing protein